MLTSVLVGTVVVLLAVAFVGGRKYERKQFVRVGYKKQPTVQDMVFKDK